MTNGVRVERGAILLIYSNQQNLPHPNMI